MRRALLGSSALVPAAAASLMFAPTAEAVTLDKEYLRELPELGRLLYHAVNAVEWELDPETEALKVVFDDGWRGVFEVGEYIVDGDEVFLWPENIYIEAFPVHAVWNILWGHPAGVMAGGGIWWLLGRNSPPVAVDDFLTFTEGQTQGDNEETLFFNVLGDDYDPNSDVISLQPFDDVEGTFGRFTMNAAGTDIQYHFLDDINATNLAEGETATDTATYSIIDEHGLTDTATLTVTITGINKAVEDDDEPSNESSGDEVSEDATSVTLTNLLDNASDPDGGDPFISAVVGGVVGQRVDVAAGGYFIINTDGTATYHPDGDFEGLDKGDTTEVSIQYTVSDGRGSTNSSEVTVTVVGENDGFTDADESKSVNEDEAGQSIGNILSVTDDPDEDDSHSITDVGDSGGLTFSPNQGGKLTVTANGVATFDPEDDFDNLAAGESEEVEITYTVSDSDDNGSDRETDTSTLTLTVQGRNDTFTDGNETLTVSEDATSAGSINILGTNDAGSISDDPDTNDTHTIKTFNGQTVPTTGLTLTSPAISGGTLTVQQNGTVSFNPDDDFHALLGTDETLTFTYEVTDNASTSPHTDTSTLTIKITAENDAIVDGDESHTTISALKTQENTSISSGVNVLDNVSDVDDGDTKHVSDSGTKLSGSKTYAGDNGGSFTLTAEGAMSFDPGTDFDKLAKDATTETKITYQVTDGDSTDTSTVTVQVTGVNDAPDPVADTAAFTEDATTTVKSFNATNNDTDVDGGTIELSDFISVTKTYGTFAETSSGDDIQYTLANSSAAVQALAKSETVSETAAYTITDGQGGSATTGKVTAKITGVNDDPTAIDFKQALNETNDGSGATTVTFAAMDNADDVDAGTSLSIALGTQSASHGAFAMTASGNNITYAFRDDSSLDSLDTKQTAQETVTYTVSDENGGTVTKTITVTINGLTDNEPPKFTSASSSNVAENSNTAYTVAASDDQTAESSLSYEMLSGDDSDLFNFDATSRKLTFKSAPSFEDPKDGDTDNEHTVKFKVTDTHGATATKTHTVKVTDVNETPVAVADTVTVTESEESETTGNDGNLLTNDTDVDAGDGKTVSAISLSGVSTPTVGAWIDLPDGGRIRINADGTYDFDADGDFETLGAYDNSDSTTYETIEVGYTVEDTAGLTATSTLTITVQGENDAPTVVTKANDVAIQHGETAPANLTFWVPNANDDGYTGTDNGIALTFGDIDGEITALTVAPASEAGLTIAGDLSTITGTAALVDHLTAETHTVTVTVKDDDGATASDTLNVYIGLNASADTDLVGKTDYTFEGSNVADDVIDATNVKDFGRNHTLKVDLGDGNNRFLTKDQKSPPATGSSLYYTGGDGEDYLHVRAYSVSRGASEINAGDGKNTLVFGNYAASEGSLVYTGGDGEDVISGRRAAGYQAELLKFDLGDDEVSDTVSFQAEVGAYGTGSGADIQGKVEIYNFDPIEEDEIVFGSFDVVPLNGYELGKEDFEPLTMEGGNIIVRTLEVGLGAGKPAVNFTIVGDYTSTTDFTWSTNDDDNLVLS